MKIEYILFLLAALVLVFVLGLWTGQTNLEKAAVDRGHGYYDSSGDFDWTGK